MGICSLIDCIWEKRGADGLSLGCIACERSSPMALLYVNDISTQAGSPFIFVPQG